jgi:hypothetical protein
MRDQGPSDFNNFEVEGYSKVNKQWEVRSETGESSERKVVESANLFLASLTWARINRYLWKRAERESKERKAAGDESAQTRGHP